MRELSLFTGAGGGLLGSLLLGWEPVQFVEHDAYCQRVLAARFPDVPRHSDVRDFHPAPGSCDIVTGGFPCQPFSQAGKRLGEDDPRNMWPHAVRVLVESGAPLGFFENVPGLLSSGYFGTVLGDLAEAGFDAEWCVLGADDVGAPHRRKRLWILAYSASNLRRASRHDGRVASDGAGDRGELADAEGQPQRPGLREDESRGEWRGRPGDTGSPWWCDPADVADAEHLRCDRGGIGAEPPRREAGATPSVREDVGDAECREGRTVSEWWPGERTGIGRSETDADPDSESSQRPAESWRERDNWLSEPYVGRVATGVASRVDRLRALGNGRVPQTMAAAFTLLARAAGMVR